MPGRVDRVDDTKRKKVMLPPVSLVHVVNVALLAGLWLWSWNVYPHLPDEIPGHVGLGGQIRWDETSFLGWFTLPLIATGVTLLNYLLAPLIWRMRNLNIPSSVPFSKLLAADQAEIRALGVRFLQSMSALLVAGFWILQVGQREMAIHREIGIGFTITLGMAYILIVPMFATLLFLVIITRVVRDAEKRVLSVDDKAQ